MTAYTFEEIAILISLTLTMPLLGVAAGVLDEWVPSLFRNQARVDWTATDWLILGICFSFLGSIGDNIWWGVAWMLKYFNDPAWIWWFDHGVYSNILFRQAFKIAAGYCHLRAAVESGAMSGKSLSYRFAVMWMFGVIMLLWLISAKTQ